MNSSSQAPALALIAGVGGGLSASLARLLHARGYQLVLAARDPDKLGALAAETRARVIACDTAQPDQAAALFAALPAAPRVAVYNPSASVRGPITEVDPLAVRDAIAVTAYGAFLFGQQAARQMLELAPDARGARGTILFTGASAGEKGFAQSAAFAMGKFAQRGLAQSMARELHPRGIHVAWINIDGGIRSDARPVPPDSPDSLLDPDAIAQTYLDLIAQHRSAWTHEIAVRPWVERF
ncbi:MAG: SDR family NAD(P)-dependent oxidoreductase [Burkholderiaceae bacterium]